MTPDFFEVHEEDFNEREELMNSAEFWQWADELQAIVNDLCPHGTCHFMLCECDECPNCDSVHTGDCVHMSAQAEDRLTYAKGAR